MKVRITRVRPLCLAVTLVAASVIVADADEYRRLSLDEYRDKMAGQMLRARHHGTSTTGCLKPAWPSRC
jgi:hypothetical protein